MSDSKINAEELVYTRLKEAVYKRFIRPGSKLVETTIANQLGVSRTPVRAAIKRLEHEGYIQLIPNRGAFVVKPSAEEIKSAFAVRIHLEKMATRLAAKSITTTSIKRLRDLIEEEKQIFESLDTDRYYKMNENFHLVIAESSGNSILVEYVRDIANRTSIYSILFDPLQKVELNPSIIEHTHIVDGLEQGNEEKAEKAMELHLVNSLEGMNLDELNQQEDFLFL